MEFSLHPDYRPFLATLLLFKSLHRTFEIRFTNLSGTRCSFCSGINPFYSHPLHDNASVKVMQDTVHQQLSELHMGLSICR